MKAKTPIVHNIAFLSDLAVTQDGEFVKVSNTLDANLRALDTAVQNAGSQTDYTVTVTESTPEGYAKAYTLTQNNTTIGTINIPKDMVVQSGSIVDKQEAGAWGPAGKYIELTLANSAGDKVWIAVADLVDTYTVQQNAAEVQLAIDANREISASIVAGSIAKGKLDSGVQASLDKADTALQPSALDPYATTQAVNQALDGKADKVENAVNGNFAALDANGNLVDSGAKASDFVTGNHTHASLENGNASLDLSQEGVATISTPGPNSVIYRVDVTGGELSATVYGQPATLQVPTETVDIPVTFTNGKWQGQVVSNGVSYGVNTFTLTETGTFLISDASAQMPMMGTAAKWEVSGTDSQDGTPTLGNGPDAAFGGEGTAFTGSVNSITKVSVPGPNVSKTLATTDDVATAINALDAQVTSSDGTNVQVKVTETNGKITAVNITKDTTYSKPATGIPTADIADGAITASKLGDLSEIFLTDTTTTGAYVGKKYKLSVFEGRLMIEEIVSIPQFERYGLFEFYDHYSPEDESSHNTDKCLLGFDANNDITVIKQSTCADMNFRSTPAGMKLDYATQGAMWNPAVEQEPIEAEDGEPAYEDSLLYAIQHFVSQNMQGQTVELLGAAVFSLGQYGASVVTNYDSDAPGEESTFQFISKSQAEALYAQWG